jgi:hypothetical protein
MRIIKFSVARASKVVEFAYVNIEQIAGITERNGGGSFITFSSGWSIEVTASLQEVFLMLADPSNSTHIPTNAS